MTTKRRKSGPRSSRRDEPPAIGAEWVEGADLWNGEKLVRRGRPRLANPRVLLSIRLLPDVVASWKASGPGWQTRMADLLTRSAPKGRARRAVDR